MGGVLKLKAGEWVEVRSREEILASLDAEGRLDNLPFMPEMLEYCGRRLRVSKTAHKTCDPVNSPWSFRRIEHTVHLDGVRCDGGGHGGCEAGCLIFWKEAWLKRASPELTQIAPAMAAPARGGCSVDCLRRTACTEAPDGPVYSCQATDLRRFTSNLPWWDLRQYIRDIASGNLDSGLAGHSLPERFLEKVLSSIRLLQAVLIWAFNSLQKRRHGVPFPQVEGELVKTPLEVLNLQPGELVQVRSREEILATLDSRNRNRGLLYDAEMLRWSGGIYRVLRRVHKIVDEKTGRMLSMKNACIVLEGAVCKGDYHQFCPRGIYHYWRENWLLRVTHETPRAVPAPEESGVAECAGCVSEGVQ